MRCPNPISLLRFVALLGVIGAPLMRGVTPAELSTRLAQGENILVIDVRPAVAFAEGHVPGAINIPAALLPHKPVPAGPLVVICGDGLGRVDDAAALKTLLTKPGLRGEVLAGGYAAWLAETRLSTAAAGVRREQLPGITYQQVVTAAKSDLLLVDLRTGASTAAMAAASTAAKSSSTDLVTAFADKLGVPVVGGAGANNRTAASGRMVAASAAPVSSVLESLDQSGKLLVLVADNEADANEAARQLRARGNYRFTILIGGTEAIRYEGRTGSGRMTGDVLEAQAKP